MKRLLPFLLLILISACYINAQQNQETRSLDEFTSLSVGEAINVELIKGNREEALVSVRGADLEDVRTSVSGGHLRIEMAGNRNFRNVDVDIQVTFVELNDISVSSAADLNSRDVIVADRLEVSVSSAGDAELEVEVDRLEVKVSSAGDLRISGTANSQYIKASSSGDYYGFDLMSNSVKASASSSGDIKVTAREEVDAQASSGGSVYYKGDPEKVYANSSSGGRVRKD